MSGTAKFFLILLLILVPLSISGWHVLNARPSSMDETRHMKLAMDYRAWATQGTPLTNEWAHVYPPLYHLSILPALTLRGLQEANVAATHLVYMVIFVFACFLLGRSFERPSWQSVLAAFLCLGYPIVLWASRRALIDFPLMTWVTLSIALLHRTKGFAKLVASVLFGIVAGLGLLMKPPFFLFMLGPVLWTVFTSREEGRLRNFVLAAVLALAIALPWYIWQGAYFFAKASSLAAESQGPGTNPHTLAGWLFYMKLMRVQMGLPSLVFTVLGVIFAIQMPHRDEDGLLFVWFFSGYVLLSLLVNKDPRHTVALLPAAAILGAWGWGNLAELFGSPVLFSLAGPVLLIWNVWAHDRPAREDWKHAQILELMAHHHDRSQRLLLASVLSHHPFFFSRTFKWSAMQKGIDVNFVSPGDSNASFPEFIVTRPGNQGSETVFMDKQWQDLRPQSRAFTSLFRVSSRYPLPDHSEAIVYERNPHPRFEVKPLKTQEVERRLAQALGQWVQGNLKVSVKAAPAGLAEGQLDQVRIACSPCSVQGARIQSADVVVEKPWINLYRLWDENRIGLLAFQSISPKIELLDKDVSARLATVKDLQKVDVQFKGGKIRVAAIARRIPVSATAETRMSGGRYAHLDAILDNLSLWKVVLPGWVLGKAHLQTLWLYAIPDFPGRIVINRVTIGNGKLQIS